MRIAAVALGVSVCVASSAWACGNSMRPLDRKVDLVAQRAVNQAKRLFDEGKYADALSAAGNARTSAADMGVGPAQLRILRQADRIDGLSRLKLGNAKAAVAPLKSAAKEFGDDLYVTAKLGQALVESGDATAGRKLLEGLVEGDLLPDGDTWAALAQARADAGDKAGALQAAKQALQRDAGNAKAKDLIAKLSEPAPVQPAKVGTKPAT